MKNEILRKVFEIAAVILANVAMISLAQAL